MMIKRGHQSKEKAPMRNACLKNQMMTYLANGKRRKINQIKKKKKLRILKKKWINKRMQNRMMIFKRKKKILKIASKLHKKGSK